MHNFNSFYVVKKNIYCKLNADDAQALLVYILGLRCSKNCALGLLKNMENTVEFVGLEGGIKRKRSGNYNAKERGLLVDLVGKYASVIECKKTDGSTMQQKEGAWQQLTGQYNAQVEIARDTKALKQVWLHLRAFIVFIVFFTFQLYETWPSPSPGDDSA